jgi:WD40 repeat protein
VLSRDGKSIATASGRVVRVLDATTGRDRFPAVTVGDIANCVAFNTDSTMLAVGGGDAVGVRGTAQILDAATGRPLSRPLVHHNQISQLAWSPTGSVVVTGDWYGEVRLWEAPSGRPVSNYLRHADRIELITFSRDGRKLCCSSSTPGPLGFRVWDARSGEPLGPPQVPGMVNGRAVISSDGRFVAALTSVRTYLIELREDPRPVEDLVLLSRLVSARTIDESGASVPVSRDELANAWNKTSTSAASSERKTDPVRQHSFAGLTAE